jgi:hypothetical protein
MRFRLSGWKARIPVACAIAAVLVGGVTSSAFAQAHSTGPRIQHKSITVRIPASELNAKLGKLKVQRAGHPGEVVPLDDTPSCPDNWENGNLVVNWTYDSTTRITLSSTSYWNSGVYCVNMAYEHVISSLFYNGNLVKNGDDNSCGTPSSTDNQCGVAGVVSTGNWACTAGCDGGYQMSSAAQINLPAGWNWVGSPPVGCYDNGAMTIMICSFSTGVINVPTIN